MLILIEIGTPKETVSLIHGPLALDGEMKIWNPEGPDPLGGCRHERVVFISQMEIGWMNIHQQFFKRHKDDVLEWILILPNATRTAQNQMLAGVKRCTDAVVHLFAAPACDKRYWEKAGKDIAGMAMIQKYKVLIYSKKTQCGKKTLAKALAHELPACWCIETTEDEEALKRSNAEHLIIAGTGIQALNAEIPEGREPYYVLTMADENVLTYMHQAPLPGLLFRQLPRQLKWTRAKTKERLFYCSALYELWRMEGADPRDDERFVMWDSIGLPMAHRSCAPEKIERFLNEFNQVGLLAAALNG